jgi:phosphoglucosamine mutase
MTLALLTMADADRFMAFHPEGRLIDGDAMIYLERPQRCGKIRPCTNKVVITVMSNFGFRKALDEAKIGYDIVAVGDKNVQARLKRPSLSLAASNRAT